MHIVTEKLAALVLAVTLSGVSFQSLIVMDRLPPLAFSLGAVLIGVGCFIGGFSVFSRARRSAALISVQSRLARNISSVDQALL